MASIPLEDTFHLVTFSNGELESPQQDLPWVKVRSIWAEEGREAWIWTTKMR